MVSDKPGTAWDALGVGSSLGSSMACSKDTWDACLADVPISIPKQTLACRTLPCGHFGKEAKMPLA